MKMGQTSNQQKRSRLGRAESARDLWARYRHKGEKSGKVLAVIEEYNANQGEQKRQRGLLDLEKGSAGLFLLRSVCRKHRPHTYIM